MYAVIGADGNTYGPVDVETLKSWCKEGRVTPETNLVDGVSGRTLKASELQDLYNVFPAPAATPAPTPAPAPAPVYEQPSAAQSAGAYAPRANTPNMTAMVGVTPILEGAGGGKSKLTAALLAFFLGIFGAHRFYLGYTNLGFVMLAVGLAPWLVFILGFVSHSLATAGLSVILFFICGTVVSVWALVDFVLILVGNLHDADGLELT